MTSSPVISELTKATLYRLEKALDQENKALAAFDSRNLIEYSRIKTQSLLDLQRSAAMLTRENTPPEALGAAKCASPKAGVEPLASSSAS